MRVKDAVLGILVLALGATSIGLWIALQKERALASPMHATEVLPSATARDKLTSQISNGGSLRGPVSDNPTDSQAGTVTLDQLAAGRPTEEFWEARRKYMHLQLGGTYKDAAKLVGIGDSKANALIDLLAEQLYRSERAANEPGNKATAEEWERSHEQRRQEDQAEIASFLGERGFAKWLDYQASLPTRTQVRDFGRELALSGEPLTPDQVEPLVALIHAERMKARQELGDYQMGMYPSDDGDWEAFNEVVFGRKVELMEAADQQIVKLASPLLSLAQVVALEKMLKHERDLYGARLRMMEAGKPSATVATD